MASNQIFVCLGFGVSSEIDEELKRITDQKMVDSDVRRKVGAKFMKFVSNLLFKWKKRWCFFVCLGFNCLWLFGGSLLPSVIRL